jgi:hypothetical protein
LSAKHHEYCLTLYLRGKVPVATLHFQGLVAQDVIDNPLINPCRREARRNGVPQHVHAPDDLPLSASERAAEMVVAFPESERSCLRPFLPLAHRRQPLGQRVCPACPALVAGGAAAFAAPLNWSGVAKERVATGMNGKPCLERFL